MNGHIEKNTGSYSIPQEAQKIFLEGVINNALVSKNLPPEAAELARNVKFEGSALPSVPINWRFAESISSLKALEATMVNVLLKRKYNVQPQKVTIDTDHAQLFFMSLLITTLDGEPFGVGRPSTPHLAALADQYFPSWDRHGLASSAHRASATNIYRCADGRFFHLHGSMDPAPTLRSLGLPLDAAAASEEASYRPFVDAIARIDSEALQRMASDEARQAGTICWTADEYAASEHGRANAHVGLYEVDAFAQCHIDLNWGKWNCCLDFKDEADRKKCVELIKEADVVVTGYRPGVLDKYGFSYEGLFDICKERERGLIVVRENSYGWHGPWSYRSGWQQISDANCGVSMEFGRAMGNDEPVTPVFPNSDYCTGVCGVVGTLDALMRRAQDGGSYKVDVALNYYSQWLVNSVGTYPAAIWKDVWARNGSPVFRHYHNMPYTIPRFLNMLTQHSSNVLFKPEYFEERWSGYMGRTIRTPKPVAKYEVADGVAEEEKVKLGFNVSTRTNGVDKPRWPEDLMTEIVA
ncbi:Acetyl-CoA:oxalate CoA-transferase [Neofusicoccum parvum]|uniref:Acetyl-CoA:oxalate CoA-transferase n=1 Tax=Neofusicoccum parvum TaxID=310453 RepID=A0ACB5RTK2_9PEZI|nr:Acetyl-CoA:oxalate CoA-transferase [Neofusicoccum parvum]